MPSSGKLHEIFLTNIINGYNENKLAIDRNTSGLSPKVLCRLPHKCILQKKRCKEKLRISVCGIIGVSK